MIPIEKICLSSQYKGLKPFIMDNLQRVIVLTGPNGSGKTRLLNLLADYLKNKDNCLCKDFTIFPDNTEINFIVSDFSHYDAPLQLPSEFPYYVVSLTAERLKEAEFSNIDKEALLYIQCLAQHNIEEFNKFNELLDKIIGKRINYENNKLTFFGLEFNEMHLSPGQQYLLRLCVTLFCNQRRTKIQNNEERILLLDEPEMHLHPGVLLKAINEIINIFTDTQIWIATHSITLLSSFDTTNIWYMYDDKPKRMNNNSYEVLKALFTENINKTNYREKLEYFIQLPNLFALYEFAKESLKNAISLSLKKDIDEKEDPQKVLAMDCIKTELIEFYKIFKRQPLLLDFGAGKGRFFECLTKEEKDLFEYYAYDIVDEAHVEDKERCISLIAEKYGINEANNRYYNEIENLKKAFNRRIDYILLINVLHEIDPCKWENILKGQIKELLSENGKLIIIEEEELGHGENASSCGFLVLTKESSKKLFNSKINIKSTEFGNSKKKIMSYIVNIENLENICFLSIKESVSLIHTEALEKIKIIRNDNNINNKKNLYQKGIQHAFWLHQYANASIALDLFKEEYDGDE